MPYPMPFGFGPIPWWNKNASVSQERRSLLTRGVVVLRVSEVVYGNFGQLKFIYEDRIWRVPVNSSYFTLGLIAL